MKQIKKLVTLLFSCFVLCMSSALAIELYVDDALLQPDVPPTIIDGYTYAPVRVIFEALQAQVQWEAATGTATAQKDDITIQIIVGGTTATVNGQSVPLDAPARLVNGRTMVPVRFVAESLQADVKWDGQAKAVYITTSAAQAEPLTGLEIQFLDVGQADSILLRCGTQAMLIDAGNHADGELIAAYLHELGITQLDYIAGTHPHEDHIGGMASVIMAMPIKQVLLPDATSTTQTFSRLLTAVEAKNLSITIPQPQDTYQLGDAVLTVVSCLQAKASDFNNASLIFRLQYGDISVLFTGDAEQPAEQAILDAQIPIQSTVLKVGHHGSDTSTSQAFLDAVAPEAAIISCGANNPYGHPAAPLLNRLQGCLLWRTDTAGTIVLTSDGTQYTITAKQTALDGNRTYS